MRADLSSTVLADDPDHAAAKDNRVQARDKDTGLPMWSVEVLEFDPKATVSSTGSYWVPFERYRRLGCRGPMTVGIRPQERQHADERLNAVVPVLPPDAQLPEMRLAAQLSDHVTKVGLVLLRHYDRDERGFDSL